MDLFRILDDKETLEFKEPHPVKDLLSFAENTRNAMEMQARTDLYMARRLDNPLQAVQYQIWYKGDQPLPTYGFATVKHDIQSDIEQYLNDKSKLFSRTTDAKALLAKIDKATSNEELLACLSEARKSVISKDLKSRAPGKTNEKGSRFQDLLNKGLSRVLLNAKTKDELLTVESMLRGELLVQLQYIDSHAKLEVGLWKQIDRLQDPNLTHNDMSNLIKELKSLKEAKSNQSNTKAKIDFQLMDNTLNVMSATLDKMSTVKIDPDEKLKPMEVTIEEPKVEKPKAEVRDTIVLPSIDHLESEENIIVVEDKPPVDQPVEEFIKDFATKAAELYKTQVLAQQLSKSQQKGEESVSGFVLVSSISSPRDGALIKKIADFTRTLNSDVQLSDVARFEIMRGMLSSLHEERKGNAKESTFLESLTDQTFKSEKDSHNGKEPKSHEDCLKEYQRYTANPLMIENKRKVTSVGGP